MCAGEEGGASPSSGEQCLALHTTVPAYLEHGGLEQGLKYHAYQ